MPTIIRVNCRTFSFVRSARFSLQFAGRYSDHDAEQIESHGYAQASIDTKVRVLKVKRRASIFFARQFFLRLQNVLEKQFDRNKTFKHFVDNQRAMEIRSKPFGRDRFGASYWLFMVCHR